MDEAQTINELLQAIDDISKDRDHFYRLTNDLDRRLNEATIKMHELQDILRRDPDLESMEGQIRALREERDSARREVLLWLGERCSRRELSDEIRKRGWEYLEVEKRRDAMDRLAELDEELGI